MSPTWFIILILLWCTFWRWYTKWRLPENFPPGPKPLPIIGSAHHLSSNLLKSFQKLQSKYGNIFGLRIGPIPSVVISDYDTVVKIFKSPIFTPRPHYLTNVMGTIMTREGDYDDINKGVVFSSNEVWDEQRKFILRKLNVNSNFEDSVNEEVEKLVEMLKIHGKMGPVNLLDKFNISIINSLWKMVAGSTFDLNDHLIFTLYQNIEYFISSNRLIGICMVFPWLRHFISYLGKIGEKLKFDIRNMMNKTVEDHLLTYEDNDRDMVDSFIKKIKETQDTKSSFFGLRGRTNLEQNLLELFGAGANPVSTTLSFSFLFLALHPDIQTKVVHEIEENIGDSTVLLEHRKSLPYTMAFLHEVLRITAINFIGTPHMNSELAEVNGYTLPAGTTVFAFLWRILNDEEYWDRPDEFRPSRFIVNGQFVKDERLIPFGTGRRQCLGMALANTEMFLFLTNMIRKLKISSHPQYPLPPPIPTDGFVMGCPQYFVKIETRE